MLMRVVMLMLMVMSMLLALTSDDADACDYSE